MDGEITIGTKLVTDKFDRQIMALEKRIKKQEDKGIKINAELVNVQEEKAKYEELKKEAESYQATIDKIRNVQSTRAAQGLKPLELTDNAQKVVNRYNELQGKIYESANAMSKLTAKENKLLEQQSEVNSRVSEYKQKIENVKIEKQVADVEKLKSGFNNVGSSIQGAVSKVARLALGIFGIRSAFMALRRASSDLASYDQQYATNLEYIRYALTQMIAPVLQWIVRLAATLLGYINAIVQGWFGINLFARGSAENFNKMKAGASGVSKAVKEIKKQLMGFDEVNVLTADSDTGTGAGAGGVGMPMPDFDLSAMQGEPPAWLKWIIDNKDVVLSIIAGLLGGMKALLPLIEKYGLKLGAIKALGIGLLIAGVVYSIQSLIKYLKDPSWTNFGKIIQGIGTAILGLGAIIGSVPVAVAGAVVLIVGTIVKYWEQIKSFLQNGLDWLKGRTDWVRQYFGIVGELIFKNILTVLQSLLNWFDIVFTNLKQILDGVIQFIRGVFTGNWQQAFNGLRNIATGVFNIMLNTIVSIFNTIGSFISNKVDFVKSLFRGMVSTISGWFNQLGITIPNTIAKKFKSIINNVISAVENILNKPIGAINSLINEVNKLPGVKINKLGSIKLGRLAVGGIVNMPNKGRLIGGQAIAGESGAEGVIPLTDTQAMETLGSAIGRHVIVNLTNITKVGNRQIAREVKQINAEQEFAFNS